MDKWTIMLETKVNWWIWRIIRTRNEWENYVVFVVECEINWNKFTASNKCFQKAQKIIRNYLNWKT